MKRMLDKKLFDLHMRAARQAISRYKYYRKIAWNMNKTNFRDFAEGFLLQAEEQVLMAELYIAE